VVAAQVADHIVPHRGDSQLFWLGDLQSLCWSHHSGSKQVEERRGYRDEIGSDGWPTDPRHPANTTQTGKS
jgi:5-methylcytosine-specific restriction enzyme A